MAANLKGNLGLKSSPLAPTACKLSTQYLVLDHMTNHYNKIAKAKSAIDSKPPKSLSTSQKLRDRRNRDKIAKSPRTRPVSSMSHDGIQAYQDIFNDEPEDEEEQLVHSIMKSTLLDKGKTSSSAMQDTRQMEGATYYHQQQPDYLRETHYGRPSSARSVQSGNSSHRLPMGTTSVTHDPNRITYQGDVLDKRPYLFTEPERPFTPRTLKNNHQSRLKNSKCYNPPPKSGQQLPHSRPHSAASMGKSRGQPAPEVRSAPRPQPRSRPQQQEIMAHQQEEDGIEHDRRTSKRRDSFHGLGDTMESTGQLSESMLMDITLQSRDGRHQAKRNGGGGGGGGQHVPPLAISMDQDHMHWLQEQASKAQVRARSRDQIRASSLHSKDEEEEDVAIQTLEPARDTSAAPLRDSIKREAMENLLDVSYTRSRMDWARPSRSLLSCSSCSAWVTQLLLQEDEDQKYLAFAKEVTDDVLSRGICTDSVLHRVFENHIERKKGQLDEGRMRQVVRDLRRDLGLRDSSAERTPHAALSDANYNNTATAPISVVTNGEAVNGSSSNQQASNSSKGTTGSTSAKDESSSNTFSPGVHYRGVLGDASRGRNNNNNNNNGGATTTTTTSLEPLHVMSSPSENGALNSTSATLESASSIKFGQTGDMVETITSEVIQEDSAREREEERDREEEEDVHDGDGDELSATQALKQYEFDLTVKEGTAEMSGGTTTGKEDSEGTAGSTSGDKPRPRQKRGSRAAAKLERPATGERRHDSDEVRSNSSTNNREGSTGSAGSAYRLQRRDRQNGRKTNGSSDTPPASSGTKATDNDDASSIKSSSSSQRPAVRPRTRVSNNTADHHSPKPAQQVAAHSQSKPEPEESEKAMSEASAQELQRQQQSEDDYDDDYEDEEEQEEDVDESTHRTSDDDF